MTQVQKYKDLGWKFVHVIDVETTGLKPEEGHCIVEIGVMVVALPPNACARIQPPPGKSSLVHPYRLIPAPASGIHHLVDADVKNAPELSQALDIVCKPFGVDGVDICAAHNSPFEREFLPMLNDRQWIDTLRCAQHVWPDAPDFKEQTLRYWLPGIALPGVIAHRALPDATVGAHILVKLLAERTVDELLALTTAPVLLTKVDFSKNYGQLWTEAETGFLCWVLNTAAQNAARRKAGEKVDPGRLEHPDVIFTVREELRRRNVRVVG
jgi:exodeoxyribonuclease X